MRESATVSKLADLLYDFLPASGNNATAFPIAATRLGVGNMWPVGLSKKPAITRFITNILEYERSKFCAFIIEVVQQSMTWRSRSNPLTREEMDRLNQLLPGVSFQIPELLEIQFLDTLPRTSPIATTEVLNASDSRRVKSLSADLMAVTKLEPQPRGYAFEKFLTALFDAYNLAPRGSFRLTGEQIDGSFLLDSETYLLEAKWKNDQTGASDLHAFSGKIAGKAHWTRGLFVSHAGFSPDGLVAFGRGAFRIVCVDGLDLYDTLDRGIPVDRMIARKVRHAAETGNVFSRVRDLFPS